jgi:hypothetical protein
MPERLREKWRFVVFFLLWFLPWFFAFAKRGRMCNMLWFEPNSWICFDDDRQFNSPSRWLERAAENWRRIDGQL